MSPTPWVLIPALILMIYFVLLSTACLRLRTVVGLILSWFLAGFGEVVLTFECLSLLGQVHAWGVMIFQLVFCFASWLIWKRLGKPALLAPFKAIHWSRSALWNAARSQPVLAVFALGTILIYGFGILLILVVPPNNYDSMTYHLSRVGYWIQRGSLFSWPTPDPRQTTFPFNAELGILWLVLFWGSDQLAGLVQWVSVLASAVAIYGLSRSLGASRAQGVFAALLWASLPAILLQSTSTQNNLVTTAFFLCLLYFFFLGVREKSITALGLSGLALGLAVGTKVIALMALPGLALACLVMLLYTRAVTFKQLLLWGGACLAGLVIFGAMVFIQNYLVYGNPFSVSEWVQDLAAPPVGRGKMFLGNLFLYANQAIDFTGLPLRLASGLYEARSWFMVRAANRLRIPVQEAITVFYEVQWALSGHPSPSEELSWFGPLSILLIYPAVLYQGWQGLRRRESVRLALALSGFVFLLVISLFSPWTPFKGRYMVLPIAMVAPLVSPLYALSSRLRRFFSWAVVFGALMFMVVTTLYNDNKPLIGEGAIWNLSYQERRTISNPKMAPIIDMVEKDVPKDAVLATDLSVDSWDYPFFGTSFQRRLVQTDPLKERLDLDEIHRLGAGFLLIAPSQRTFLTIPAGLHLLDEVNDWWLFTVDSSPIQTALPASTQQLLEGQADAHHFVALSPEMKDQVGLIQVETKTWDVEEYNGQGFYWMGEGLPEGLSLYLWSEKAEHIQVVFELSPGPGRNDALRHVLLTSAPLNPFLAEVHTYHQEPYQFDQQVTFTTTIDLLPGLNWINLVCTDAANVLKQSNGDERPLLVMVSKVQITPAAP